MLVEYGGKVVGVLIVNAVLARAVGVEKFGEFQYFLSAMMVFAAFGLISSAEIIVPRLVAGEESEKDLLGNAFFSRLAFSAVGYACFLIFIKWTSGERLWIVAAILGVYILVNEPFGVVSAWLQSKTNSKPRSLIALFALSAKIVSFGALYFVGSGELTWFALAWVVESLLISFGLLLFYRRVSGGWFFHFSFAKFIALIQSGAGFFAALLLMYTFIKLDGIMVKQYSSGETLGNYMAASQVASSLTAVAPILAISMAPLMVYSKTSLEEVKSGVFKIAAIMILCALSIAATLWGASSELMRLVYGSGFSGAVDIFRAMLLVGILVYVDAALTVYTIRARRGGLIALKWLCSLIVALLVDVLLIERFGAIAMVIGQAAGYSIAIIIGVLIVNIVPMRER